MQYTPQQTQQDTLQEARATRRLPNTQEADANGFRPEVHDPRDPHPNPAEAALKEKWGWKILTHGFTAVPNILLATMGAQKCTPMEFCVLVQLMRYWWRAGEWPHPSVGRLAEDIGCGPKTVRRAINGLVKGQIIERTQRRRAHDRSETNIYSFAPLVNQLDHAAVAAIADTDLKRAAVLFPTDPYVCERRDQLSDTDLADHHQALRALQTARGIRIKEKA
jgi:hypothetical protein